MKKYFRFSSTQGMLFVSILITFPLIFRNAIVHDFPMGYAGLFTQMAAQIADANFLLPVTSPYYGPGGIPFAYPPFGLYLLAFLIKLSGKYYFFLRWLPPVLSLVSIAFTFLLSSKLFRSPVIAAFVSILAATSTDLYIAHTWSAGVVRAPAFIFAILAVYFYIHNLEQPSLINILLTGFFLGLSILSHLAYGLFGIVWVLFFSFTNRNWVKRLKDSALSVVTALLISSIWIVPTVARHGWSVFLGAFSSHGGEDLLLYSTDLEGLLRSLLFNLAPITSNILLVTLVLFGAYFLFRRKRFDFVIFFLLIALFFPENARFVFWLGCFFAGCGLWLISNWLYSIAESWLKLPAELDALLISAPLLALLWWAGFSAISSFTPFLNDSALELGERAPDLFPLEAKYLALLAQDEAEWMPFLLRREPLVAQWGSEWLGHYDQQTQFMSLFQGCRKEKDWLCIQAAFAYVGESPEFIITYRFEKKLNDQISATGQWDDLYSNNRYVIWQVIEVP